MRHSLVDHNDTRTIGMYTALLYLYSFEKVELI